MFGDWIREKRPNYGTAHGPVSNSWLFQWLQEPKLYLTYLTSDLSVYGKNKHGPLYFYDKPSKPTLIRDTYLPPQMSKLYTQHTVTDFYHLICLYVDGSKANVSIYVYIFIKSCFVCSCCWSLPCWFDATWQTQGSGDLPDCLSRNSY